MNSSSRRALLRTLFASGAAAAAASVIVPVVADSRQSSPSRPGGTTDGRAPGPAYDILFEEMYQGRHIRARRRRTLDERSMGQPGTRSLAQPSTRSGRHSSGEHAGGERSGGDVESHQGMADVEVLIDGRPLRLMRRADGSYLSMADHYTSHPTVLAAARGAVDALGTSRLAATTAGHV